MIVFDNTALTLLLHPNPGVPIDSDTGQPVNKAQDRMKYALQRLVEDKETILIPSPVLAEFLTFSEDEAPELLSKINKSGNFRIADFDKRAAVETAAMTRDAIRAGDKKDGSTAPWQKVKIDRQIIAIARVYGVSTIYSDDQNLAAFATKLGMSVIRIKDMPLPPEDPQTSFL